MVLQALARQAVASVVGLVILPFTNMVRHDFPLLPCCRNDPVRVSEKWRW